MVAPEQIFLRLAVAAVLGSAVGLERERVESAAGLRTHALVSMGSALLMIVSMFGFQDAVHAPDVVLDPSRVAAQIVSGIGFLGAGVIIFRREIIRGLTTAASIWVVAAIGMATGGGLYLAAAIGTALSLGILAVMKPLERSWTARRRPHTLRLVIDPKQVAIERVVTRLSELGLSLRQVETRLSEPGKTRLDLTVQRTSNAELLAAIQSISSEPGVREVRSSVDLSATRAAATQGTRNSA